MFSDFGRLAFIVHQIRSVPWSAFIFYVQAKKSNSRAYFNVVPRVFSIEFMLRKNGTVSETWQLKDEDLPVPEKALKAMKVVKAMKAMKAMKAVKAMKAQPMKSVKKKPSKK